AAAVSSGSPSDRGEPSAGETEDEFVQEEHPALGGYERPEVVGEQSALDVALVPLGVEPGRGHALEDPELQEDLLQVRIRRFERLAATDGQLTASEHLDVGLGRTHVPPPDVVAIRMRPGAEPDVRSALPVPEVVEALEPRARPVRDLVMPIAGLGERLTR